MLGVIRRGVGDVIILTFVVEPGRIDRRAIASPDRVFVGPFGFGDIAIVDDAFADDPIEAFFPRGRSDDHAEAADKGDEANRRDGDAADQDIKSPIIAVL